MTVLLIINKNTGEYTAFDAPTIEKAIENLIDSMVTDADEQFDNARFDCTDREDGFFKGWDTSDLLIQVLPLDLAHIMVAADDAELRKKLFEKGTTKTVIPVKEVKTDAAVST